MKFEINNDMFCATTRKTLIRLEEAQIAAGTLVKASMAIIEAAKAVTFTPNAAIGAPDIQVYADNNAVIISVHIYVSGDTAFNAYLKRFCIAASL